MAGLEVVGVNCEDHGNIDVGELRAKAVQYRDRVSALMRADRGRRPPQ